jgi:hypothetical protein
MPASHLKLKHTVVIVIIIILYDEQELLKG